MCEGERVTGGKCSATHSLKLQKNALGREGRDLRARLVRDGDQDVPPVGRDSEGRHALGLDRGRDLLHFREQEHADPPIRGDCEHLGTRDGSVGHEDAGRVARSRGPVVAADATAADATAGQNAPRANRNRRPGRRGEPWSHRATRRGQSPALPAAPPLAPARGRPTSRRACRSHQRGSARRRAATRVR